MENLKELPGKFDAYDCHPEEKTCSICNESFTDPIITPCAHRFDRHCLKEWLRRFHGTCPICRQYMDPRAALKGCFESALYLKNTFEPIWEWLETVPCPLMPEISVRRFLRRYSLWISSLLFSRVWLAIGFVKLLLCLEAFLVVAPRIFDDYYARFFWPYKKVWVVFITAGFAVLFKEAAAFFYRINSL